MPIARWLGSWRLRNAAPLVRRERFALPRCPAWSGGYHGRFHVRPRSAAKSRQIGRHAKTIARPLRSWRLASATPHGWHCPFVLACRVQKRGRRGWPTHDRPNCPERRQQQSG
jgi:hypothetical protein